MTTLDLDSLTLDKGSHSSPEEGMCVLEAVALMAGEEFTDAPSCASPVIAAFLRSWNDSLPDGDRQQLKRYIPRLIGTAGSPEVEEIRSWMALDWLVRVQAPAWLRLAGLTDQADVLASMGEIDPTSCPSILPALRAVRSDAGAAARGDARGDAWAAVRVAACAAAWAAVRDAVRGAACAAAWAAARDDARDDARVAAWDAAGDAACAAACAAARDDARDAAGDAAGAALAPTVTELQQSAHDLVDRMIEVTA